MDCGLGNTIYTCTSSDSFSLQVAALLEQEKQAQRSERGQVLGSGVLTLHGKAMNFFVQYFGNNVPEGGYTLVFGLHGGGGSSAQVNNQQWENHKKLYKLPSNCIWVAPRSPEDVWNMWHLGYIDEMIDYIIQSFLILDLVNPNKVFLTGYSAGGDGAYRLAVRLADRFAGVGAMAGHPGSMPLVSIRNLAFTIQMGELDSAYNRNELAQECKLKLEELQAHDCNGYRHLVQIHSGEAHWMHLKDAKALDWLLANVRNPIPDKLVWRQPDEAPFAQFYWLSLNPAQVRPGSLIVAECEDRRFIKIKSQDVSELRVHLNDYLIDPRQEILIYYNNCLVHQGYVQRDWEVVKKSARQRYDPYFIFYAEILVKGLN